MDKRIKSFLNKIYENLVQEKYTYLKTDGIVIIVYN